MLKSYFVEFQSSLELQKFSKLKNQKLKCETNEEFVKKSQFDLSSNERNKKKKK